MIPEPSTDSLNTGAVALVFGELCAAKPALFQLKVITQEGRSELGPWEGLRFVVERYGTLGPIKLGL